MVILHICAVENKMSNGATVAALNHINEQAKTGQAHIMACHVKNEILPWDNAVEVVAYDALQATLVRVDLVVFHEIYYGSFFQIGKLLRKENIPYVIVAHGGLTEGAQSQRRLPKTVVNIGWAKAFICGAKAIHFLSQREYATSVQWNKHYFISPNGVHMPQEQKQYVETKENLRFLYIGRINLFYKGLDILCQACGEIAQKMRERRIKISIHGPQEGEDYHTLLRLIQENHVEDIVEVSDGVFGQEKIQTMLSADAFIQPSRSEGQPMGILEAMSVGLPVIVTSGTSFDEIVEERQCGWTTVADVHDLAKTILQVYDERNLLAEKSARARACVEELFQWENVAKQTIGQYENLLNE